MAVARRDNVSLPEKEEVIAFNDLNQQKDAVDISENNSVTAINEIDAEKREAAEELPPRDISGLKWALVVLSILSSTFLFALDNTIVADVQPVIVKHFNSVGKLIWLSVAFLIGAASTNLIWGKIKGGKCAELGSSCSQWRRQECWIYCLRGRLSILGMSLARLL